MGNSPKQGIDYFSLSVDFLDDIKVRKITRACGTQSIAVLISLLSRIYRFEGYFVVWDQDVRFLTADHVGVKESLVQEIVNKAIDVGFFDADTFEQRSILTSKGIQERFFGATSRRSQVYYDSTLVSKTINVGKNWIDVNNNLIDVYKNQQSKVKESKVKDSKEERGSESVGGPPDEKLMYIVNAFEQNGFGQLSDIVRERLVDLIEEYDTTWISEAFKIAVENNKRTLKYVEGILKNWRTEGGMKLNSTKQISKAKTIPRRITRFHTEQSRSSTYTADQLEEIADKKRQKHKNSVNGLAFLEKYKNGTNEEDLL